MIDGDRKPEPHPPTMGSIARLIVELRAAGEPIVLEINGRGQLPIRDEASIQQLLEFVDQMEAVEVLRGRIARLERGEPGLSLDEVKAELNRRHGYPV